MTEKSTEFLDRLKHGQETTPKTPRRVLILTTAYLPQVGGSELAIKNITDRLPEVHFDLITSRPSKNLPEYEKMGAIPRGLVERAAHENINILEVGGGLAELTPALGLRAKVKPILVDPIDYNAVLRLFDQALVRNIHKSRKQLIQELIKRIAIITNPNHVHFFNTSLEEAVLYHPELHRTQDVVVDLAGALFYSSDPQLIWGIEKKWLPKIET